MTNVNNLIACAGLLSRYIQYSTPTLYVKVGFVDYYEVNFVATRNYSPLMFANLTSQPSQSPISYPQGIHNCVAYLRSCYILLHPMRDSDLIQLCPITKIRLDITTAIVAQYIVYYYISYIGLHIRTQWGEFYMIGLKGVTTQTHNIYKAHGGIRNKPHIYRSLDHGIWLH